MPFDWLHPIEPPTYDEDDKRQHTLAGAGVGLSIQSMMPGGSRLARILAPAAGAAGVGVAKEIFDHTDRQHHTTDWKDAAATALGALATYHDDKRQLTIVPSLGTDRAALDVLLRF